MLQFFLFYLFFFYIRKGNAWCTTQRTESAFESSLICGEGMPEILNFTVLQANHGVRVVVKAKKCTVEELFL